MPPQYPERPARSNEVKTHRSRNRRRQHRRLPRPKVVNAKRIQPGTTHDQLT
jgi:hypothetical protein